MPTMITVTKKLTVEALLDITDPDFQQEYAMGVWWAIYGDEQGTGRYDDQYLLTNIANLLEHGWALSHVGFYLGMIHGGWLVAQQAVAERALVRL